MSSTPSYREQANAARSSLFPLVTFPLTFQQRRLWFLDQLEPGSANYNITWAIRMRGLLNREALKATVNEIIRRHEILRTSFPTQSGEPVQLIHPVLTIQIPLVALDYVPSQERENQAQRIALAEARRAMDLSNGPLVRVSLLRLADQDHVLILSTHHIVFDGWSRTILVRELASLYEAFSLGKQSPLQEPRLQYVDFAVWQGKHLRGTSLERQLAFWKQHLAGAPASLELPTDRARPAMQSYRGAHVIAHLPQRLTEGLERLSRSQGVTLFMTLFSGFIALLSRYTGQEDIVIGVPVANRTRREVEEMIGFFANTLALRTQVNGNPSFRELMARVRQVAVEAYDHQDLPFEKLVEELKPERSLSINPVFQVLFSLQNAPRSTFELKDLTLTLLDSHSASAKFDLSLFMDSGADGLSARAEFNTDLFDGSTIGRMLGHFRVLLEAVVADPELRLAQLPLLTEPERRQILVDWNRTERAFPSNLCLHELFEAQARSTPASTAISFRGRQLSYGQLNERSNQLAHFLISRGLGPGLLIGIYLERSLDMMIALLAVQKCGAAYVPLDPAYPRERLRLMLDDSGMRMLLSQEALLAGLPEHAGDVFCLDRDWHRLQRESTADPLVRSKPDDLLYVIFTSGSTGRPKGVQVPHRAVVNLLCCMQEELGIGEQDVIPALASFAFDMSIPELYLALVAGGRVEIVPSDVASNGDELARLLERTRATLVHATPTTWSLLLEAGFAAKGCKRAIGAEPLARDLFLRLMESEEPLYNFYGPTETTVWSTFHRFRSSEEPISIGRPLANTQVYLLDRNLEPVPIGVPGEIHIAGLGVTHGYLSQERLTAEKFIANRFRRSGSKRIYKTGDWGRYLADGRIEFLGRADTQVKLRGFRIELGDIEAAISAHPSVSQAVVLVREDQPGDKRLVAYLVCRDNQPSASELRAYVKKRLPDYMVPSAMVILDNFPLSANGKVDRRALPAPGVHASHSREKRSAPETPTEQLVAQVWAAVLGQDEISREANFFDLGGHSLLATRAMSRLRDIFRLELPLRMAFEAPTLEGISARIETAQRSGEPFQAPPLARIRRDGKLPLSFGQQRLWFLERLEAGTPLYNIPVCLRLMGKLEVAILERALSEIVARHEVLRTNFATINGEPVQIIRPAEPVCFEAHDVSQLPPGDRESAALEYACGKARQAFHLDRDLTLRAFLVRLEQDEHWLLMVAHHIAFDRWSTSILLDELAALYQSGLQGKPSPLAELPIQYVDFAAWQRQYLEDGALERQLSYWKQQLRGAPPTLHLPADRPRPPIRSFLGGTLTVLLPGKLQNQLRQLSSSRGVTLFMTLLAAFQVLLYRYSGQEDVIVGSPIAGRNKPELEKLLGFFVNTLALRTDLSGDPTFGELLARVREVTISAFVHQDLPFEKLVEELHIERDLRLNPLFQVMFILQNVPDQAREIAGLAMSPVKITTGTSKFDMTAILAETPDGLRATFQYNVDIFDESTVARMMQHYRLLLEAVVSGVDRRISELPLLTSAEFNQVVVEWNQTAREYSQVCLPQLVEAQVERTPEATAVIYQSERLTYAQLNARANQLARYLRRHGVGADVIVGVCLERSLAMVVAVLGILKAGGAYLPLDPELPPERLATMLEDAQPALVLTEDRLLGLLSSDRGLPACLDRDWGRISAESTEQLVPGNKGENIAYLLYTSGSTGVPKGVPNLHRSVVNQLFWRQETYPLTAADRVLQKTPHSFDVSVWEFFWPLMSGATLVVARPGGHRDPAYLVRLIREQHVTTVHFVPSMLRFFLEAQGVSECWSLRRVFSGGEALSLELETRFFERLSGAELHNLYGPTEAAIDVSYYHCRPGKSHAIVPIGRPVANTALYILDRKLQPVPVGVPGELHISGIQVSPGYWKKPEMTAEKFLPHSFSSELAARLYKTGDLARFLPDGNIEYLGRIDQQIKIRGFRVELGEIEVVLRKDSRLEEAVVLAVDDVTGDTRLVAYLVSRSDHPPSPAELRSYLKAKLPEHMVPTALIFLDHLPLTPTGKLDRKALPRPDLQTAATARRALPQDDLEAELLDLWRQVLQLPEMGIADNFFDVGGHSLVAVRLVAEMERALGRQIPLAAMFRGPTVESIAQILREGSESDAEPLLTQIQAGRGTPFFAVVEPGIRALGYAALATAMGPQQSFYKLQSPRLIGRDAALGEPQLRHLAREYIAAMRSVQPRGPYYLGGMCLGTHIAEHMVLELEGQEEEVGLFVIFDTWVRQNTQVPWRWRLDYYQKRLRELMKLSARERLKALTQIMIKKFQRPSDCPPEALQISWNQVYWPGEDFKASRFRAPVTLFKRPRQPFYYVKDETLGWASRCQGEIKIHIVDFPHRMLREPYVRDLGKKLSACLAEAATTYSARACFFEHPGLDGSTPMAPESACQSEGRATSNG